MSRAALDIQGLTKTFSVNGSRVTALQDISLTVRQGEFVSIIGSSGCGKSTLLRIIAGLEIEYQGSAQFRGAQIRGTGLDRGVVFQEHRLFPMADSPARMLPSVLVTAHRKVTGSRSMSI